MSYNPYFALGVFLLITLFIYLIFKSGGWFWQYRNRWKKSEKVQTEDLLKQLYHLEKSLSKVQIKDLLYTLEMPEYKLVKLLDNLSSKGLITLDKDDIRLTENGKEYALRIVRVHRLWEKYLAEKTGYDKKEWHDRAEKMEHLLDKADADKLARQLRNPLYDPHGDPIPSGSGKLAQFKGIPLNEMKAGQFGKIVHLEDEPEWVYREILALHIYIGTYIEVKKVTAKEVVYFAEGEELSIPNRIAQNISVVVLDAIPEKEKSRVRLTKLQKNEKARIVEISEELRGENRRRLLDLGFVKGSPISIDLESPLGNTRAYLIKGTSIALREDQASKILIERTTS